MQHDEKRNEKFCKAAAPYYAKVDWREKNGNHKFLLLRSFYLVCLSYASLLSSGSPVSCVRAFGDHTLSSQIPDELFCTRCSQCKRKFHRIVSEG